MVACSGIDSTFKIFAPMSTPPEPSFSRMADRDKIMEANAAGKVFKNGEIQTSLLARRRFTFFDFLSAGGLEMIIRDAPELVQSP